MASESDSISLAAEDNGQKLINTLQQTYHSYSEIMIGYSTSLKTDAILAWSKDGNSATLNTKRMSEVWFFPIAADESMTNYIEPMYKHYEVDSSSPQLERSSDKRKHDGKLPPLWVDKNHKAIIYSHILEAHMNNKSCSNVQWSSRKIGKLYSDFTNVARCRLSCMYIIMLPRTLFTNDGGIEYPRMTDDDFLYHKYMTEVRI